MITGEQIKAGRLSLGLSQLELARLARFSQQSIARVEANKPYVAEYVRLPIHRALERAGVAFVEGEPPRLKMAVTRATWNALPKK